MPSLSEGLPVSLLEAMAVGLPVIATEVGANPDVIDRYETGILVPPGNPDAVADAIITLLGDKQMARTMGLKARRKVKELYSCLLYTSPSPRDRS